MLGAGGSATNSTEGVESTEDSGLADPTGENIAGKGMGKRTKSAGPVRDGENKEWHCAGHRLAGPHQGRGSKPAPKGGQDTEGNERPAARLGPEDGELVTGNRRSY